MPSLSSAASKRLEISTALTMWATRFGPMTTRRLQVTSVRKAAPIASSRMNLLESSPREAPAYL